MPHAGRHLHELSEPRQGDTSSRRGSDQSESDLLMAKPDLKASTRPSTIHPRPVIALAITAAALIFLLTGVSLWLSYEHLHDVGQRHGFADDPIRAWAWPATLDLFYASGEVLILRAALARRVDWWAISLVVFGA